MTTAQQAHTAEGDAFLILHNGTVLDCSAETLALFGRTSEDFMGRPFSDVVKLIRAPNDSSLRPLLDSLAESTDESTRTSPAAARATTAACFARRYSPIKCWSIPCRTCWSPFAT